jgi:predicted ATPase
MHVSRIKVYNYKSFRESQDLELRPGFNIVVGQNDAGKTALLQAMGLRFPYSPHRSLKTLPTPESRPDPSSRVDFSVYATSSELRACMKSSAQPPTIPLPELSAPFCREIGYERDDPPSLQRLANWLSGQQAFEFVYRSEAMQGATPGPRCRESPSFGHYRARVPAQLLEVTLGADGRLRAGGMPSGAPEIGDLILSSLAPGIYCFSAERLNVGRSNIGTGSALLPNAANLAEVIHVLQGSNPSRFRRLSSHVREIFPHVQDMSAVPVGPTSVEIRVWNSDPKQERGDLAVPLSECGTGIGQVLAMLYVVITSDSPRTILIDEPQSFLHPEAVRKLIEVLKRFRQHQFIIGTHSPTVISAADPDTITMVRLENGESVLEQMEVNDAKSLQFSLAEVGARLSDVFGADNVLWVEGETEEICFPKILEKLGNRSLMGTAVVGVVHTGDFEGRDAATVLKIYERLTKGKTLLPPAIGFLLDRECRSEQEERELKERSKGLARFLPRRMFENYLLNSGAVAKVANSIENFRPAPVSPEEVDGIIQEKRTDRRFYCSDRPNVADDRWVYEIDGAKLLKQVFSDLSESRVAFDKIRHSVALAEWLIDNAPDDLAEVKELLLTILDAKGGPAP